MYITPCTSAAAALARGSSLLSAAAAAATGSSSSSGNGGDALQSPCARPVSSITRNSSTSCHFQWRSLAHRGVAEKRCLPPLPPTVWLNTNRRAQRLKSIVCSAELDSNGGGLLRGLNKLGKRVETDTLDPAVRDATIRAVDELGRRVTVGDVAAKAGVKLSQAEKALQALATDAGGFLEVSDEGDVLYGFPSNYRSNLTSKSLALKVEPVFAALKGAGAYLTRVAFGTALLTSILLVVSTIVILASSRSDERDNRSQRGGGGFGGVGFYFDPFNLFWYFDPYYGRNRRVAVGGDGGMNFFQSVFSFVFGDGDPNEGIEDVRWRRIGEYITSKGGVVAAEEIAPYLDISKSTKDDDHEEAYMLPVLQRLDGQPEVDDKGNILYRFPSLQRTATDWRGRRRASLNDNRESLQYLSEAKWTFSEAPAGQQALTILLGLVNLIGVVYLATVLKDVRVVKQVGSELVLFVYTIMPGLVAYATSFFAIPAVRYLLLQRRNNEIEERNNARMQSALALARPDLDLRDKLLSARNKAEKTVIGSDRIVYTTEKDLTEQDYEAAEWDQKLRDRERWN
eukprot:TRINITY_DN569_c0_g1_i1.p1 TRINITY_DN569_c0_g1~~TRINITY_DN569_c0_g1_i1.p1  ORF type:complete len:569 (-),score=108.19 TRINITY_DN569_c0_g1_i1:162-1868(-)